MRRLVFLLALLLAGNFSYGQNHSNARQALAIEHERVMYEAREFCTSGQWDMGERIKCVKQYIQESTKAFQILVRESGDYAILCEDYNRNQGPTHFTR